MNRPVITPVSRSCRPATGTRPRIVMAALAIGMRALAWGADVVTSPAPPDPALLSADYSVEVNGHAVPVYRAVTQWHDGKYSFANFDFRGAVTIKIRTALPLAKLTIRPAKYGIHPEVAANDDGERRSEAPAAAASNEATFNIDRPFKISFEPTGCDSPLLLFGNEIERDVPRDGDPNLIYFGPGVHRPPGGIVQVTNGQTLYLAGGAVVKAAVFVQGDNIRIAGRGVLDGTDWGHSGGPRGRMLELVNCHHVVIEGITIRGAFQWTIVPTASEDVRIENIKIVGSRVGNDDGIDPCNCRHVLIRECFLRTDDDCIAIKGIARGAPPFRPTEDIEITDCTFWTDYANVFRIGSESRCEAFRDFRIHDIDVIHSIDDRHYKEYWMKTVFYLQPSNNTPMENIRFENIRINGEGRENLIKIMPMPLPMGGSTPPGKTVRDVVFRNIEVYGETKGARGSVYVTGVDAEHTVENITFDRVVRYGDVLSANSPDLEIGPFVSGARFPVTASTDERSNGDQQREIHVAKTGADSNSGAESAPLLTIDRAAQLAQPGDTVVIHAGIYRERVIPLRGGESERRRIVYIAAPGERVVVTGSEPVTVWQREADGLWHADVPRSVFGTFNPFTVALSGAGVSSVSSNAAGAVAASPRSKMGEMPMPPLSGETPVSFPRHLGAVYVDGVALAEAPSRDVAVATPRAWFAESDGQSTRLWANFGDRDPTRSLVEINVRPAVFAPAGTDVNYLTVDGIVFAQSANEPASIDGAEPGAVSTGGGTHWIIQNCTIRDARCVGLSIGRNGHDLARTTPTRPAFGELEDIDAAGHHVIRNNLIRRCGQAGIFGLWHGTRSEIYGNQIEEINLRDEFAGDDVAGVRLAVAVDTVIRDNLVRQIGGTRFGYGIVLGPLYQGVRISANVIERTAQSALYFWRSHGPALVDNNVIVGPGVATQDGVTLRSVEATVFAQNLFADCRVSSEPIGPRGAPATISYRPHSLVVKQTIPALALDERWFGNIFVRAGLERLPKNHDCESDYNAFMGGAAKSPWGDEHSAVVETDGGFALTATEGSESIAFALGSRPRISGPAVTTARIGWFALTQQGIEQADGRALVLMTDFFGNALPRSGGVVGPFGRFQIRGSNSAVLFECRARNNSGAATKEIP